MMRLEQGWVSGERCALPLKICTINCILLIHCHLFNIYFCYNHNVVSYYHKIPVLILPRIVVGSSGGTVSPRRKAASSKSSAFRPKWDSDGAFCGPRGVTNKNAE